MSRSAAVLLALLAVALHPLPADAQTGFEERGRPGSSTALQAGGDDDLRRVAVFPLVGFTTQGWRYSRTVTSDDGTPLAEPKVGPSNGTLLGAGVDARVSRRLSVTLIGGYAGVNYDREGAGGRGISGDQTLVRVLGGVKYRLQAHVPGYFSAGGGVTFVTPEDSPLDTPAGEEEERMELAGYVGAGIDVALEEHTLRIDGKLIGAFPGADAVPSTSGPDWEGEGFAVDYTLYLGYLIPL